MSFAALDWAWRVKTGSPGRKAVLMALAQFADDEGMCWPSQETIAEHSELSARSVRDHLAWLEQAGFLVRSERRWADSKKRRSDLYQLQIGVFPAADDVAVKAKSHRKILPVAQEQQPENSAAGSECVDASAGAGCTVAIGALNDDSNRKILPVAPTGKSCTELPANFAGYESPAMNTTSTTASVCRSRRVAMTDGWVPDADGLKFHLQTAGLALEEITQELVAEFVGYWLTQPAEETHASWCRKLVQHAKRTKARLLAEAASLTTEGSDHVQANTFRRTRPVRSSVSLADNLQDTSWADGASVV